MGPCPILRRKQAAGPGQKASRSRPVCPSSSRPLQSHFNAGPTLLSSPCSFHQDLQEWVWKSFQKDEHVACSKGMLLLPPVSSSSVNDSSPLTKPAERIVGTLIYMTRRPDHKKPPGTGMGGVLWVSPQPVGHDATSPWISCQMVSKLSEI